MNADIKDTIWYNGKFYTQDKAYPSCSAVYCRNGVIMAMGSDEEILSLHPQGAASVSKHDLKGNYVMPGFVDSHMHLLEYAEHENLIHLEHAKSFDEVVGLCRKAVASAKENHKWVRAVGFNQDDWDEKILPTRKDLDRISTELPITIRRACLHVSVCNTKAMELMGLLDKQPEKDTENYDTYEDGSLNGIIREASQLLINDALPPLTKDEIKDLIVYGCEKAAEKGIVEIQTDDFHSLPNEHGETILAAYKELADAGQLPIRIYEQCYLTDEKGLDIFLKEGHYTGETAGLFRIGPLKIVLDGSLGSHSAKMREDYKNDPGQRGISYYGKDELYRYAKKAHDAGMQIAVHTIGNGSLDDILDVYDQIRWENPRTDTRHGIVHCQIMDRKQQDRFRAMNLLGYVQPIFLRCDMNIVDDCVGPELAAQSYNWRRFLDEGVHLSGGSDCPVESFDVMENIQYAVSRTNFQTQKSWYPENAVTLEEAIHMFTDEGAYASFAERTRGTISIGKEADFAILDKDLFQTPVDKLNEIRVLGTVVKGNIVFKATD